MSGRTNASTRHLADDDNYRPLAGGEKATKQETTRSFARRQLPVGNLEVRSKHAYRTRISDVYLGWHGYAAGVSKGIGGGGAGGGRLCGRAECGGRRCAGEGSGRSN